MRVHRPAGGAVPGDLIFRVHGRGALVRIQGPGDLAEARVLVVGTGAASGSDIAQDVRWPSITVSVRAHRWMI